MVHLVAASLIVWNDILWWNSTFAGSTFITVAFSSCCVVFR